MNEIRINISKEYTTTPGGRYVAHGAFSGEDFREKFLIPLFKNEKDLTPIFIELDGTEGYPSSFLEECFGGLARKVGKNICLKRLKFISEEDSVLLDEIKQYIRKVAKE